MQIDRSNYEIWLIDWLDGNLDDIKAEKLRLFLEENPDLKEEFDELPAMRLNSSAKSFQNKDKLKKTTADISELQFEYLCAAYLEKDLPDRQIKELMEITENDQEKKRSFELIQKTRLVPEDISYKWKNRLIRKPFTQKVIRLSLIGMSAAAVIFLFIITYFPIPRGLPGKSINTSQNLKTNGFIQKQEDIKTIDIRPEENKIRPVKKKKENLLPLLKKTKPDVITTDVFPTVQNESLSISAETSPIIVSKISVPQVLNLKRDAIPNTLIASNSRIVNSEYDDGRSRLSKFIAKAFREKILKEKTANDRPLKAYEIAEAGVSGLNKLLGWEMALDKKNDENGELKSVYFSSKILKFNAPVKKAEPLP
jgi:hypothetical protein